MKEMIQEFEQRLVVVEEGLELDLLTHEQKLLDLEDEVYNATYVMNTTSEKSAMKSILKRITYLKKEYDFYDADTERAYMFSNGEDED